ncbi:plasmid mobilization relaxosome protein MobC [Kitasatospora sp. NPDC050543]|uniref:plasmid mobilization relaxosome protein MobC n=1 Tax=Kitasatospora sp. NPDC050543 TaxID=3364054 RepID=UPI0037948E2C
MNSRRPSQAEVCRAAARARACRAPTESPPRFSDSEWTLLQRAADQAELAAGGYAAAAVADYRRGIQELMESNRQLGAVGNNLNHLTHYVNAGGQPNANLRQLLERIEDAIGAVDEAVALLVRR